MERRCNSEVCMATATGRTAALDLSLSQVLTNPATDWKRMTAGRTRVAREIEVDWKNFCQDQFIFSHCFVPETAVLMADGTEKPIEDVVVGDEVVSHTGNVRRVIKVMVREVDEDLVSVKAASLSETLSTGEHPYYVLRKERSKCKHNNNLKCVYGHTGRCSKRGCSSNDGQLGFAQASELHCGDRVFTPTMGEVRGGQFSFEQMRLLGYYASEGGVAVDERPTESNSVRFHISKDEMGTLGEEICQLMSQCFGVDSHGTIETEEQGGTTLSFASDEAYEWCLKHAGHIAKNKRLSKEVMFAEPMLQAEMLDTWVAGDGCVDSGQRRVRISTASPFLASQAEVLFSRIGGLAHIYEGENPGGPTGRDKKFRIFQVAAKSDCLGVLDGRYDFPSYSRWPRTGRRYRHAACSVAEITTIENKRYKGPVYNLSVEEDESYVANRMAVHNCTIVASVNVEANGYHIDPACSPLVNNNGNAWTNPILLSTFRSFVGGENYLEHVQIPELSKGKILDAVIRPIRYKNAATGSDAPVYYTDILVATERRHDQLCKRIASGELSTMSMGCLANWVQCSKCGQVLGDADPNCEHIEHHLMEAFTDENGIKRVVAELCGRSFQDENGAWVGDSDSLEFIEASWVDRPAFEGAVLNHFLSEIPKAASKILDFPTHKLEQTIEELFRTRVADSRGMMVLRIAIEEMNRRRRQDMSSRVAKTFWS